LLCHPRHSQDLHLPSSLSGVLAHRLGISGDEAGDYRRCTVVWLDQE
jgi:hypothetical protein